MTKLYLTACVHQRVDYYTYAWMNTQVLGWVILVNYEYFVLYYNIELNKYYIGGVFISWLTNGKSIEL